MQLTLCRHIKTNGTRCKAPSLTDRPWRYFPTATLPSAHLAIRAANSFEWNTLRSKLLINKDLHIKSKAKPKRMKTLHNFGGG